AADAGDVALVDGVRELEPLAVVGQQRDVEVARVQQLADDVVHLRVEALQCLRGDRQFGDPEQRALQPLGPLAFDDLRLQVAVAELQRVSALLDPALELFARDRKSTRLNSSHVKISYAVFCLKKHTS